MNRINAELGTKGAVGPARLVADKRTGKSYRSCQSMVVSPVLKDLRQMLYPDGTKILTKQVLDLIGLEGLAVLWMDDGTVVTGDHSRNRGILNKYVTLEESSLLSDWIVDLTGAKAVPYRDGSFWRVRIEMGQMPRFVEKLKAHIHSSMAHKVTLVYQRNTRSRRIYEASLTIPFVDEGDKATRARSVLH